MDDRSLLLNHSSQPNSLAETMQLASLQISLPNKGFRILNIKLNDTVESLIDNLVGNSNGMRYYGLRLRHMNTKEIIWLAMREFDMTFSFVFGQKCKCCF
jgi:hypothetical protein